MNIKSWLKYLFYIILIFAVIFLREYVGGLFTANYKQAYRINFSLITINMLIVVSIGILLGLEHIISETRKEGTWKINSPKIILLGLTSLYFSLTSFLIFSNIQFVQKIIAFPLYKLLKYGSGYVPLFQLILGYVIITSFYKCNKKS